MSEIAILADAFRGASDEDTMKAMNILSSRSGLDSCLWYVVPSSWMRLAWALLVDRQAPPTDSWRQDLTIENGKLVAGIEMVVPDHTANEGSNGSSRSSNDQRVQFQQKNAVLSELRHKKMQQQPQHQQHLSILRLRSSCIYGEHFFLLGANAWLLCKEKFGFDYEIACPTLAKRDDPHNPLVVSVPLAGQEAILIPFPTTGRFPIETSFRKKNQGDMETSIIHPGNVSDDEHDDLYPGLDPADDQMSMSNPQDMSKDTILLLPTSTTSSSPPLLGEIFNDDDELIGSDVIRRKPYGSGLGNLGNTCFMNSTLQCLAHTDPLRKYFLSGEYINDLNRDNPLGTRGELTIQFASLLGEMWRATGREIVGGSDYSTRYSSSAVYPRTFKQTLGRFASQFVGYDQHDSQELAVYLLDSLHEDTNRVTSKPYVEKPEKDGNQSDEEASKKAWELHLQRDDSKVLSFFMGQVKSRVQCCKPECNRVSTTFDPFMFLSVPVPGSLEKNLEVTFVPLDFRVRPQMLQIAVSKTGTFKDLATKLVSELVHNKVLGPGESIPTDELCAVDVFQNKVYKWYAEDDLLEQVRDYDKTFVYQLPPPPIMSTPSVAETDIAHLKLSEWSSGRKRYILDASERAKLDHGDEWVKTFVKYIRHDELNFHAAFNPLRGDSSKRASWYNKTFTFLSRVYKVIATDTNFDASTAEESVVPTVDDPLMDVIEMQCNYSPVFAHIKSRHDIAVLDYCLVKMRAEILRLEQLDSEASPASVVVEIRHRVAGNYRSSDMAVPVAIRIPSDMTVFGLRECLAKSFARYLGRASGAASTSDLTGMKPVDLLHENTLAAEFGSPELAILCQVPLTYEKKSSPNIRSYSFNNNNQLGSLRDNSSGDRTPAVARTKDPAEAATVADVVGHHGAVIMEWPETLLDKHFDLAEYETTGKPSDVISQSDTPAKSVSLLDCVAKYCQMEQLEETDTWYCNRCRESVQAWKKVDIYTAPPILIIHLKRFLYSALTHRRDKICTYIDFPLDGLDLTDHVSYWNGDEEPIYDCYAVSNHFGGLGGGHYTAYCLNDDGKWAHYDDSRITTDVDPKEVVSAAAYCLYYRRRDVAVGEDFSISLQTPSIHMPIMIPGDAFNNFSGHDERGEISSTNAAMVDDDGMEMDDIDNVSRATSPMGSIEDNLDPEHYGDDDSDCPPLLIQ